MKIEKVNIGYGPYLKVSTDDGEHIGDVMQKINGNRAGSWGFELAGERGGASFRRHYTSARLAFEAMIKRANITCTGIAVGSDKPALSSSENHSVTEPGSPALR
jgi:hypothetical protein